MRHLLFVAEQTVHQQESEGVPVVVGEPLESASQILGEGDAVRAPEGTQPLQPADDRRAGIAGEADAADAAVAAAEGTDLTRRRTADDGHVAEARAQLPRERLAVVLTGAEEEDE